MDEKIRIEIDKNIAEKSSDIDAERYLTDAAELGDTEAQYMLSYLYFAADDFKASMFWAKIASDHEYDKATYLLGRDYLFLNQDDKAKECFMKLINKKTADGYLGMLKYYEKKEDFKKAFKTVFDGANVKFSKKNANANLYYNLARYYHYGIGCEVNISEAIKYYKKDPRADSFYELAKIYKRDLEDENNYMLCLIKAAHLENLDAMCHLGFLLNGSMDNAGKYYVEKAANGGHYNASIFLVREILEGKHYRKDYEKAEKYLKEIMRKVNLYPSKCEEKYLKLKNAFEDEKEFFDYIEDKYNYYRLMVKNNKNINA